MHHPHIAQADDRQVKGYLFLAFTSVNVHVGKVAVRPEWRRQGVARSLFEVRGAEAQQAALRWSTGFSRPRPTERRSSMIS